MSSLREQILSSNKSKPQPLAVEGWGNGIYCRKLNGLEAMSFYSKQQSNPQPVDLMIFLVALCVCDENGVRVFNNDDANTIGEQPIESIVSAFTQCSKVNGFDADEKKEVA